MSRERRWPASGCTIRGLDLLLWEDRRRVVTAKLLPMRFLASGMWADCRVQSPGDRRPYLHQYAFLFLRIVSNKIWKSNHIDQFSM